MTSRLTDRVAVVTGAASGIGRACALRLAEEGADVVVADLSLERGAATVAAVEALGRRALFVRTDTSREADCDALIAAAVAAFGRVDIAVAAAGISHATYVSKETPVVPPGAKASDWEARALINKSVKSWEKVLAVNLTGVMLTDRAAARQMIAQGSGGAIINIGSISGAVPFKGAGDYCVSKAGVWMLTKVLAQELAAHRVRVNAVGPGTVETPMAAVLLADDVTRQSMLDMTPLKRFAQPEEIAAAVLFLAGEEAGFITGEILYVDGGTFTG